MATTALFVEIVVVGLQAAAWLLLLILAVRPISVDLETVKGLATPLTAAALAVAYVLGVIVDRLSDSLYDLFRETRVGRLVNRWLGEDSQSYETPAPVSAMRLTVMHKGGEIAKFLDYQRTRLRIARGTVVNAAMAIPVGAFYLHSRCVSYLGISKALVVGLIVIVVALFAAERIHSAYLRRLSDAYRLLTRPVAQ